MDLGSERSKLELLWDLRVAISSSCDLGNVPKLAKTVSSTKNELFGGLKDSKSKKHLTQR